MRYLQEKLFTKYHRVSGRPICRYLSALADISVLPITEKLIGIGYWYRSIRKPISVLGNLTNIL